MNGGISDQMLKAWGTKPLVHAAKDKRIYTSRHLSFEPCDWFKRKLRRTQFDVNDDDKGMATSPSEH